METMIYPCRTGGAGETKQETWENDFGDGYTQAGGTGINNEQEEWAVSWSGYLDGRPARSLLPVRDFLKRHKGYKSFLWTPPGGVQGRYRAKGYTTTPHSNAKGLYTIATTFKESFAP